MRSLLLSSLVALWAILSYNALRDHPVQFTSTDSKFMDNYGDWAIVAGASEGLGAAWARRLCVLKVNVLLIARRQEALEALQQQLQNDYNGVQVDYWVQDLGNENLHLAFQQEILSNQQREYGFLVYNAAYSNVGPTLDISLKTHQTEVDVNVRGVLHMTHVFAHYLMQQEQQQTRQNGKRGGIILMSSLSGELGTAYVANYAATKAWNTAYSHALRHELKPHNIDVLACVAGPVRTPNYYRTLKEGAKVAGEQSPEQVVEECIQGIGGSKSSIRTGMMSKLARFILVRLLPLEWALVLMSSEMEKNLPDHLRPKYRSTEGEVR